MTEGAIASNAGMAGSSQRAIKAAINIGNKVLATRW